MKVAIVLLMLSLPLNARIGEKYSDYAKRINQPEKLEKLGLGEIALANHQVDGMTVSLVVNNGIIATESYKPIEPDKLAAVLAEQKLGFKQTKEDARQIVFTGSNDKHFAIYNREKKKLSISNWDFKGE